MISIGPYTLKSRVLLSPLSGITDYPMRVLVHECGAGLVFSEMLASEAIKRMKPETLRMSYGDASCGTPWAVQIAGRDPFVMAEAARFHKDQGSHIIDINMGCPAKKVVNGYAGSALMKDETQALRIIREVVRAAHPLPVTLKMRLGWDEEHKNALSLCVKAQNEGISMITVHARTRQAMFSGYAQWAQVRPIKKALSIPLIINGDITSGPKARQAMEASGADGVMIGRGIYGRPWLCEHIHHYLRYEKPLPPPSAKTLYAIARQHMEKMHQFYGDDMIFRCRKYLQWYSKGMPGGPIWRRQVADCHTYAHVLDHLKRLFVVS